MVGFVQSLLITAQTADAIIVSYARKFKCKDAFYAPQITKIQPRKIFLKKTSFRGLQKIYAYANIPLLARTAGKKNTALGYRPTAGHLTLDQRIEVRILVSQPYLSALFVQWPRTSGSQPGNRSSNLLESAIFLPFCRQPVSSFRKPPSSIIKKGKSSASARRTSFFLRWQTIAACRTKNTGFAK